MNITHELKTEVINITADTAGFDVTTNCQTVFFVNTGADTVNLHFNEDDTNSYELEPGAMLTIDVNGKDEIITDRIKVLFASSKLMNLKIVKQTKKLIL